jgi:hypothetical protein
MILLASLMLLTVASLCALTAYRENLHHQQTLAWMRLHSLSLNLSSAGISEPAPVVATPRAEPRRVHKLSIPVPFGGLNRDQAKAATASTATASRA